MKKTTILIIAILTALLAACTPIRQKQENVFELTTVTTPKLVRRQTHKTILVSRPIANPGYTSNQIIYSKSPFQLRSYSQNRWTADPANMLMPLIAQSLKQSGYFKAVVEVPFAGLTDYRIDTRLLQLRQVFTKTGSHVQMQVKVDVLNDTSDKILGSKTFYANVPAPHNNYYGAVLASNKATAIILKNIARFTISSTR